MNSRWVYKLENKFGRKYIPNLMRIIVIGMAFVYMTASIMASSGINILPWLTLTRSGLFKGQIWRLITFVFIPPLGGGAFMVLLSLFINFSIGRLLEQIWGSWRFNLYYFTGIIFTIITALIFGQAGNYYLNLSLILAVATVMPDTTFMLFFIIPFKAKWLLIAYPIMLLWDVLPKFVNSPLGGLIALLQIVISIAHYLLFFGPTLKREIKEQMLIRKNQRNWKNNNKF